MKSRVLVAALFTELLVLLPTAAVARWYDPGTGSWLSDDPVFGQLNDPMSLNPHLYAHGNPTKYTDPTGEAVCRGRDEAACRALFAQAVRLHGALSSFSEKAVIQGSGGEVLSIEPSGGFGGLEFLSSTSNLAISVDLGSPTADKLDLEPISERTLTGLVGIFERFKRTGGFGAPGSPESGAFAKGALEGLALQSPTEAGGLLDPSALFLTDKVLLGLSGSQMEMFQSAVARHNQFLQRQYMGGYMLAATTMGLSIGVPGAAGADAAVDMDTAMMLRANELSNAQANSRLVFSASQQAYADAMVAKWSTLSMPLLPRGAVLADTNLFVQAAEKGSAAALAEIRAGPTFVTTDVLEELINVNTHAQRMSRLGFLQSEGVQLLPRSVAGPMRASPAFQEVYSLARNQGHSATDASLAGFSKTGGFEVLTAEKRLSNLFNFTYSKAGVRIRRVR
jgi:predicted nucleic acid-binding protein